MCVSFFLFVESIVVMEEFVISQMFELLQFICGDVVLSSTKIALVVDSFRLMGLFFAHVKSNTSISSDNTHIQFNFKFH